MENVILISLSTEADLTDLEPANNFLIHVQETNNFYRGNGIDPIVKMQDDVSRPQIIRLVSTNDNLLFTDYIIECTGTIDLQLPEAAGLASGQIFYINNNGGGTVSVIPFGTEGIQTVGNATYLLAQDESICVCINANSNGWLILSKA